MDLFHIQEEAVGSIFWHPKGWKLYRTVEAYMRRRLDAAGYQEVKTPQLVDRSLWEESGHWDKYRQNMFITQVEDEDKILALKPMNCPCHVQIFRQGLRSYRELPLRMAEFGSCHRYEPSGSLHGIMRVRAFTQDDAHIFCTEDQIAAETVRFVELLSSFYTRLRLPGLPRQVLRPPGERASAATKPGTTPKARCAKPAPWPAWNTAEPRRGRLLRPEAGIRAARCHRPRLAVRHAAGGPQRCRNASTPNTSAEDGARHRPVMLHRAIFGSFERFIGILIEQYAGRFPLWLAPVQAVVATIVSDADEYATEVAAAFARAGLAVDTDLTNQKINAKVREHSLALVPVLAVVGRKRRKPAPWRSAGWAARRRKSCHWTKRWPDLQPKQPRQT